MDDKVLSHVCVIAISETACTWLANGILMVSLGWWGLDTKFKFLGASAIESCFFIPPLCLSIWAGKLSDRKEPTLLVQTGTLLKLVSAFMLLLLSHFLAIKIETIIVLVLLLAAGDTIVTPSMSGYVAKLLDDRGLARFSSAYTLFLNLSILLGGLIAAPLYQWIGLKGTLIAVLLCYAIATILVFKLPRLQNISTLQSQATPIDVRNTARPISRVPLIMYSAIVFFFGMIQLFLIVYPKTYLQSEIYNVSYFHASFILGLSLAMIYIWIQPVQAHFGNKSIIGHVIAGSSLILLPISQQFLILPLITFFLLGFMEGYIFVYLYKIWLMQHCASVRGRASGQIFALSTATRILGLYGLGALASLTTTGVIVAIMMCYLLIMALYCASHGGYLNAHAIEQPL